MSKGSWSLVTNILNIEIISVISNTYCFNFRFQIRQGLLLTFTGGTIVLEASFARAVERFRRVAIHGGVGARGIGSTRTVVTHAHIV